MANKKYNGKHLQKAKDGIVIWILLGKMYGSLKTNTCSKEIF